MSIADVTSEKKRRSLPSMLSRLSDAVSLRSKANYERAVQLFRSRKSGGLDPEYRPPQMKLRWRDWLMAFAELCVSFSWGTFIARAQSERTLKMQNMTPRDEKIQRLLSNGFAAIGNLLMGHLADSYTKSYGIVIINTAGHFTLAGLFFMSEVVRVSASEDQYGLLLSEIFFWMYIPIRATDFSRIVYGMEQLEGDKADLILYFVFVFQVASISGESLFLVVDSTGISFHVVTFVAFTANAVVLFLYSYVLLPQDAADLHFSKRIGEKICGCVATALFVRKRFYPAIKKNSWMDYAEVKYDKLHIRKTKKLIKLFLMILPTVGFLVFTEGSDDCLEAFWLGLNSGKGNAYKIGIVNLAGILSMLVFELLAVPCLVYKHHKITFYQRFLVGYSALIFALFFASATIKFTEKIHLQSDMAILRLFNAKQNTLYVHSYDASYSTLNYTAGSGVPTSVTYKTSTARTLKLSVSSYLDGGYILNILLKPYEMIGYLFADPDLVYRIKGSLPILEAPPGNNSKKMPKCFVVNFIPFQDVVLDIENADTGETFHYGVASGNTVVFQMVEGNYLFKIRDTLARTVYEVLIGGVYGIYVYLGLEDYYVQIDKVLPENTTPALVGLGVSIPVGIAKGVGMAALVAFVFINSPDGLKAVSLGYLFFLRHVSSWALFIGFYTWHRFIDATALMAYSVVAICLFFASYVLMLKYRNLYKT